MNRPIFLTRTQRLRPALTRIAIWVAFFSTFALIGVLIGAGF